MDVIVTVAPKRPSTKRSYQAAIDLYLVPAFGTRRIEQLTPAAVQHWLTDHKTEHGARRRIVLAHAVLRSALAEARRLQLVAVNVAELVKVPKPTPRPIVALTMEESRALLAVAYRHRFGALFSVALASGLRPIDVPPPGVFMSVINWLDAGGPGSVGAGAGR
jgi:site-specific recombinase XerD